MGSLEAFVFSSAPDPRELSSVRRAKIIPLSAPLVLMPITNELTERVHITHPRSDEHYPMFWRLTASLLEFAKTVATGTVAYVECSYDCELETHAAGSWAGEVPLMPPDTSTLAVEKALLSVGVAPTPGESAFDTLGLGRYHSNNEWLASISAP